MRLRTLLAWLPFERFRNPPPVVAVVRLAGTIGRIGPLRRGMTLAGVAGTLDRAFKMSDVRAVALVVNSPGGSPAQSALIAGRIRALADEHDVPVVAFVEDVAASGGYWLATAADEIFADANSIVGSIGVVYAGFGFTELIQRLGVERRLHATGAHKGALDPFQPEKADEIDHLKAIQGDIQDGFTAQVRERRGTRLKAPEDELFTGRYWTGRRALDLGLIDGLGDLRTEMRRRFGSTVKLRLVSERRSWWRRRFGGDVEARPGPGDWASELIAAVEERLTWNRFGL